MPITTVTSRQFNHDVSKVKKAAANGPVFITDRGQVAHVLLTMDDYLKLTKKNASIVDLIAMTDEVQFEPPKLKRIFKKKTLK